VPVHTFTNKKGQEIEANYPFGKCPRQIKRKGETYKKTIKAPSCIIFKGEGFACNDL